jgi:hypothetical protein
MHQPHNIVKHNEFIDNPSIDDTSCMRLRTGDVGRSMRATEKKTESKKKRKKNKKKARHGAPAARDAPHRQPCTNRSTSSYPSTTSPIRARTARHARGRALPAPDDGGPVEKKKKKKEKKGHDAYRRTPPCHVTHTAPPPRQACATEQNTSSGTQPTHLTPKAEELWRLRPAFTTGRKNRPNWS